MFGSKSTLIDEGKALPGRAEPIPTTHTHYVNGNPIQPPFPAHLETVIFGMGCFWGAERIFWQVPGVWTTAAGYAGGYTPNPTYEEVCSGRTGHTEAVIVAYDPEQVSLDDLLKEFWEQHDPTQGMRQGNDRGSQYRSAVFWTTDQQKSIVEASRDRYQEGLTASGFGPITTEIAQTRAFYHAEGYHQQYLAMNPNGYCNHGFCQVSY